MVSTNWISLVVVVLLVVTMGQARSPNYEGVRDENPKVMCKLPEYKGHCRALLLRWRYDPENGKCKEFQYGGCDGNGNNFPSYRACMAVCGGL